MNARFNLFLRQWKRGEDVCSVADIDLAVSKGLLTSEEGEEIKNTPRDTPA